MDWCMRGIRTNGLMIYQLKRDFPYLLAFPPISVIDATINFTLVILVIFICLVRDFIVFLVNVIEFKTDLITMVGPAANSTTITMATTIVFGAACFGTIYTRMFSTITDIVD